MIFLKAELTVQAVDLPPLLDLFRNRFFPVLEDEAGWKLQGCFQQRTGRINTLVDIWELENYGHFERGYDVLRAHPAYPDIRNQLDKLVETETLVFMEHLFGAMTTGENA